jgi:hypothetical protein
MRGGESRIQAPPPSPHHGRSPPSPPLPVSLTPRADIDEFVHSQLLAAAVEITAAVLREGGTFVAKIFAGANADLLRSQLRQLFGRVTISKPLSSRPHSFEAFIVCEGFSKPDGYVPRLVTGDEARGDGAGVAAVESGDKEDVVRRYAMAADLDPRGEREQEG